MVNGKLFQSENKDHGQGKGFELTVSSERPSLVASLNQQNFIYQISCIYLMS